MTSCSDNGGCSGCEYLDFCFEKGLLPADFSWEESRIIETCGGNCAACGSFDNWSGGCFAPEGDSYR